MHFTKTFKEREELITPSSCGNNFWTIIDHQAWAEM